MTLRHTAPHSSWLLIASMLLAAPLRAQSAAGDLDPQGHVLLKVFVTMTEAQGYGHPVAGVKILAASSSDRSALQTDAAGVANSWLAPGSYRLVVSDPVSWGGLGFTWDVPITVRGGMGIVELTQNNATNVGAAAGTTVTPAPGGAAAPTGAYVTSSTRTSMPGEYRKDPTVAVILSFLVPGVGHMYAGETGKGIGLLAIDLLSYGAIAYGVACNNSYTCSQNTAQTYAGVGAGVLVGNWIYSMVDASGAAHRHNRRAGFVATMERAQPVFAAGARGTTRIGFALNVAP